MVRSIEARDADTWTAMRARLWPQADAEELARETRAYLAGRMSSILAAAFVAEAVAPVGFAEVALRAFSNGYDSMPVPHVEGWYVEPFARGRGVGRELMRAAKHWRALAASRNLRAKPTSITSPRCMCTRPAVCKRSSD